MTGSAVALRDGPFRAELARRPQANTIRKDILCDMQPKAFDRFEQLERERIAKIGELMAQTLEAEKAQQAGYMEAFNLINRGASLVDSLADTQGFSSGNKSEHPPVTRYEFDRSALQVKTMQSTAGTAQAQQKVAPKKPKSDASRSSTLMSSATTSSTSAAAAQSTTGEVDGAQPSASTAAVAPTTAGGPEQEDQELATVIGQCRVRTQRCIVLCRWPA